MCRHLLSRFVRLLRCGFRLNKENIPSRAYVLFKNEEDLALFSREYDGHVFRDKQGVQKLLVVLS